MSEQQPQKQTPDQLDQDLLEEQGPQYEIVEEEPQTHVGAPLNHGSESSLPTWATAQRVESDPADFTRAVASSYEAIGDFGPGASEERVEEPVEPSAVDSTDKGLGKSGRKASEAKPEEDVDAAREEVEKSFKSESEEEATAEKPAPAEEPTAKQRAEASAKIGQVAEAAARRVKEGRQGRRTRVSDKSRTSVNEKTAEAAAKKTAEAPATPIMGEGGVTGEKPAKQTVVVEGTDGQQYVTEPTAERPKRARVPKNAATEAREVPEAVIPTNSEEPAAPAEEPKKVYEGVVVNHDELGSRDKYDDELKAMAAAEGFDQAAFDDLRAREDAARDQKTDAKAEAPAEETPTATTREEQIDEDVLSAMGGYDSGRPAKRGRKARREEAPEASAEAPAAPAEPIAEPEAPRRPSPADMPGARKGGNGPSPADMPRRRPASHGINAEAPAEEPHEPLAFLQDITDEEAERLRAEASQRAAAEAEVAGEQSEVPEMTPDEARASAYRRMGEPERQHGQPVSDETAAYLRVAGEPQMGTPYVQPGESAEEPESPFSDTEVFSGDDSEILGRPDFEPSDFEAEVLKTAGERDTRTPEEVEADDEADSEAKKAARDTAIADDTLGSIRNSVGNRLGGHDRSRGLGSTALGGEDTSWADSYFDDADLQEAGEPDPFAYLYDRTVPGPEATNSSDDGEQNNDDDEDDNNDDSGASRSLADDLLGDFNSPEPARRTRRERVGAAFRTGWDKARTYFTGRDVDSNEPDRDRRIAGRQLKVVAGAVGATVLAGALFSGLAGDTSNEGPIHVGKGPSASAEKTPGAKVDSGNTESKPKESLTETGKPESKKPTATVDDDRRYQHGSGAGNVSHTFDVGRETVKVSANNEVVVTLKQGGTVWDALDKIGDELHINHSDEDIAETVQSMHLKPGQDRQMKVGSSYTFKVQGGKLVAKK